MRISDWSSDVCSSDLPGSGRQVHGHRAEGGEVMKGWNEAMKFHERQVAKHNPREFLTRPAGLKPGSIMENGNIVTRSFGQGSIDSVAFGNIEIAAPVRIRRSDEHTSELQSLMRISYALFCLKKKK